MLSIRMAVSGDAFRICRVAAAPFMLGSAKSMTTTAGFKLAGLIDGLVPVAGLAHHRDVRIVLQHAAEAAAHQVMIVHQQNT